MSIQTEIPRKFGVRWTIPITLNTKRDKSTKLSTATRRAIALVETGEAIRAEVYLLDTGEILKIVKPYHGDNENVRVIIRNGPFGLFQTGAA